LPSAVDQVPGPSPEERQRILDTLFQVDERLFAKGPEILEVWLVEQRMKAERLASQRLTRATWAPAAVTLALVAATVALVIATFQM
jgi:hypothetical protein